MTALPGIPGTCGECEHCGGGTCCHVDAQPPDGIGVYPTLVVGHDSAPPALCPLRHAAALAERDEEIARLRAQYSPVFTSLDAVMDVLGVGDDETASDAARRMIADLARLREAAQRVVDGSGGANEDLYAAILQLSDALAKGGST